MKLPVSISFMAVGAAQFAAKSLIRFKPGRTGEAPSWEGRGADMTTHEVGAPKRSLMEKKAFYNDTLAHFSPSERRLINPHY